MCGDLAAMCKDIVLLYMQNPQDEYRLWAEDALHKLEELDKMPGVTYGMNEKTGHRYNIEHFILEFSNNSFLAIFQITVYSPHLNIEGRYF